MICLRTASIIDNENSDNFHFQAFQTCRSQNSLRHWWNKLHKMAKVIFEINCPQIYFVELLISYDSDW